MTDFRPFDEQGNMIRSGRTCTGKKGVVSAGHFVTCRLMCEEALEKEA